MRKRKMKLKNTQKNQRKGFFLLLLLAFLGILSYYGSILLAKDENNPIFLRQFIYQSLPFKDTIIPNEKIVTSLVQFFSKVDINHPSSILGEAQVYFQEEEVSVPVAEEGKEEVILPEEDKIEEQEQKNLPIVYLYNTHQAETYTTSNIEPYNIEPTVLMNSYMLKEKLAKMGINCLVEEENIPELLQIHQWNYASSYKLTRLLMEDAKKENPSLTYFVDLHRDSVGHSISTTTINDVSYAKVMFLIGLENENYKANLAFTEKLNDLIEAKYPGISRGIYKKEGPGVNGVYNQDFSPKTILIEVGGEENTIDEVNHTMDAIADILGNVIREEML